MKQSLKFLLFTPNITFFSKSTTDWTGQRTGTHDTSNDAVLAEKKSFEDGIDTEVNLGVQSPEFLPPMPNFQLN